MGVSGVRLVRVNRSLVSRAGRLTNGHGGGLTDRRGGRRIRANCYKGLAVHDGTCDPRSNGARNGFNAQPLPSAHLQTTTSHFANHGVEMQRLYQH